MGKLRISMPILNSYMLNYQRVSTAQVSLRTMWWMPTRATGSPSSAPIMAPAEDISRTPGAAKVQGSWWFQQEQVGHGGDAAMMVTRPKIPEIHRKGKKPT